LFEALSKFESGGVLIGGFFIQGRDRLDACFGRGGRARVRGIEVVNVVLVMAELALVAIAESNTRLPAKASS